MGCGDSQKEEPARTSFYLGTYTEGESRGIYRYFLSEDGSLRKGGLMAETENPSFLALSADGAYLLAVNEVSDARQTGYVSSFQTVKDTLLFLDRKPTGGAHPCHLAIHPEGYVVIANYSGGTMGLLKLREDGKLSELLDVQSHRGSGPHPRQDAPHAHSAWFTRAGGIISVDLGTDQLWFSEVDTQSGQFRPQDPPTFSMEPGSGPRHLALHPEKSWIYVVNELSSSVSLLKADPASGEWNLAQTVGTLPGSFSGENTCADIRISPDGRFLYASNRGHNSIAIFAIDPASGNLSALGHESTRGETPRNFSLSPDGGFLLVANQDSDNLVSFRRDPHTGLLTFQDEIGAPTPVCILFAP
jgi:6-phosphogluconolactonase